MFARLFPSSIRSVLRFFYGPQEPAIQKIPDEILIDVLFPYLELREILNLRKVCKWFYDLTHHGVVWKRLLQASPLSIPPLPPSCRYNYDSLSAKETEALLIRALSLERNWARNDAIPKMWSFDCEYRIADIVLLPGGAYLVASISDPTKQNWGISLCRLDTKAGVIPIAKTSTKTKAFNLQARYLTVDGVPGITIAFVSRDWAHRTRRGKTNISEYGSNERIESRYPVKHESRVFHVSLDSIESLADSSFVPGSHQHSQQVRSMSPPFRQISLIRSRSQTLRSLVLDDFCGEPYLSLVKGRNQIIFKPLNGGPVSVIDLVPTNIYPFATHWIQAIRPLPQQNQILVIRSINRGRHIRPSLSIELHNIPINTASGPFFATSSAYSGAIFNDMWLTEVHITDHGAPTCSPMPHGSRRPTNQSNPPHHELLSLLPISVSICTTGSLYHILLTPKLVNHAPPRLAKLGNTSGPAHYYRYDLAEMSHWRKIKAPEDTRFHVLPGSERTLMFAIPGSQHSSSLRGFPIYAMYKLHGQLPLPDDHFMGLASKQMKTPLNASEVPIKLHGEDSNEGGIVAAMAWDEMVGRAVFVDSDSGTVRVVDFAHTQVEDAPTQRMPCYHRD